MIYIDGKTFKSERRYESYLVKKYLKKLKKISDNEIESLCNAVVSRCGSLDLLAKQMGEESIEFFSLYFMRNTFVVSDDNEARELAPCHFELWKIANEMMVEDKYDKSNIVFPRGHAKTTIFDRALCVWAICYKSSIYTIIIANKSADAADFLDNVRKEFTFNKKILDVFGELIPRDRKDKRGEVDKKYKNNESEIDFLNGTYLECVGGGTSIRGRNKEGVRPTLVIADDFLDDEDVLTQESRDKKYAIWNKQIENVGDKAVIRKGKKIKKSTKIVNIGTTIHSDDVVSRLMKRSDYKNIHRSAIILKPGETVDKIFGSELWVECKKIYKKLGINDATEFLNKHFEDMKFDLLWPEKWASLVEVAAAYWEDRKSFMSEQMNDADNIGKKFFDECTVMPSEEIEKINFCKTVLVVDPASTTNNTSDFTAMAVMREDYSEKIYARDLVLKRLDYDAYINKILYLLSTYKDITHLIIEKNTFSGADVIKLKEDMLKYKDLRKRKIVIINENQNMNKDIKIGNIVKKVNMGEIVFVSDKEDSAEFIRQIKDFQGQKYSEHDDAPDCIAEGDRRMADIPKNIGNITAFDRSLLGL